MTPKIFTLIRGAVVAMVLVASAPTARNVAEAVMPTPEIIEKLRAEGRFEEYARITRDAQRRGMDQPDANRLAASAPPVLGNLKALVLLVDFTDNVAGLVTDTAFFQNLLFSSNNPATSLNDFYQENSYGKVTVSGDVVGWLRMPQTYAYYVNGQRGLGAPPTNAQQLAADAVSAAELAGVNFSQYDNDANGQMDGFFVVHAGPGFEETGSVNDIHSHKWSLTSPVSLDGVTIFNYTMQPEEQANGSPVNIGVFCHEFGHFFGLPDLYDIDGSSQGLDEWALMAAGNYARSDGSSPAHLCGWSKIQLGWTTAINVTSNMTNVTIPQAETDSVVYRLWTNGTMGNQYFLVENRQRTLFDAFLPGGGLLIYHVDDAIGGNGPNRNEWYPGFTSSGHYKIALEQADGRWELEQSSGTGPLAADNGDPWPGSTGNNAFDDLSTPDSRDYGFNQTQVAVWNISPAGSTMTANFDVTWSRPNFQLQSYTFTDDGDSDGVPDPGEQVDMYVSHQNLWLAASDAELSVSVDDTAIAFSNSVTSLGAVGTGDTSSNVAAISFTVPAGRAPRITDFYITVNANSGSYSRTDTVRIDVGPKQLLLIDADDRVGPPNSADSQFIQPVLEARRMPHTRWDVFTGGIPGNMDEYPVVLWYTGNMRADLFGGSDTIITPSEVSALKTYLDNGGNLFITGQQIARYLDSMDQSFMTDYLHGSYAGAATDFIAYGVFADIISDSTNYILGGAGGAANQQAKDRIDPASLKTPFMLSTRQVFGLTARSRLYFWVGVWKESVTT
jgi:immune inhibitor A